MINPFANLSARVIAISVAALVLIVGALMLLNQCQSNKRLKTENRVATGASKAGVDSGVVAVETASNIVASDDATDAQVAVAKAEIAAAVKGQKGVAAKRAACGFASYRNSPQCK